MMQEKSQQLNLLITWLVLFGYTPSVYAAEVFLGPLDIPLKTYLYVCWMGTWGALAAYLQKYAADQLGTRWKIFLVRDLVNSNLAAILVFWATQHFGVPKAIESICYTLAGYGGARTMEWAYNKWIATASGMIDKHTGVQAMPMPVPSPYPDGGQVVPFPSHEPVPEPAPEPVLPPPDYNPPPVS